MRPAAPYWDAVSSLSFPLRVKLRLAISPQPDRDKTETSTASDSPIRHIQANYQYSLYILSLLV